MVPAKTCTSACVVGITHQSCVRTAFLRESSHAQPRPNRSSAGWRGWATSASRRLKTRNSPPNAPALFIRLRVGNGIWISDAISLPLSVCFNGLLRFFAQCFLVLPSQPMIEVQNLTKRFGHFTAVDGVSFSVGKGSGAGWADCRRRVRPAVADKLRLLPVPALAW